MLKWFLDRLTERIVPLIGSAFSSTVETQHALVQASQQSELEDAARRYEAEGKTELANTLRERAARLTSNNPAAEAVTIYHNIAGEEQRLLPPPENRPSPERNRLPDLSSPPRKKKRTRRQQPSDEG